jgi:hypothetical protein
MPRHPSVRQILLDRAFSNGAPGSGPVESKELRLSPLAGRHHSAGT